MDQTSCFVGPLRFLPWMSVCLVTACHPHAPAPEADVAYHVIRAQVCTLDQLKRGHRYAPRPFAEGKADTASVHVVWRNRFLGRQNRDSTVAQLRGILLAQGLNPAPLARAAVFAPAVFGAQNPAALAAQRYALCDWPAQVQVHPPQDSVRPNPRFFLTISAGAVLNDSLTLYYYEESSRTQDSSAGYVLLKRQAGGSLSVVDANLLWTY